MRIRVEPDVLRALSKQIQYAAEQIQQKMTVLDQAIHSLEWEVESRAAVMNEWNHSKRLGEDASINGLKRTAGTQSVVIPAGRHGVSFRAESCEHSLW